jgi:FkbM family methyltransferase
MDIVKVDAVGLAPVFNMCVFKDPSLPGYNVQQDIMEKGYWAPEETFIVSMVLKSMHPTAEKITFLDIGANTGYFSLLAMAFGHKALWIEANPIHQRYFERSLELNHWTCDRLEVFVSDKNDDVLFDGWSGHENLAVKEQCRLTQTKKLCDIAPDGCLFTKIDVEGVEPDVFRSGRPLLQQGKFPFVMFEVTYIIDLKLDSIQIDMLKDLIRDGYKLYEIMPGVLKRIHDVDAHAEQWNRAFFHVHLKACPSIKYGGTNILGIHQTISNVPFTEFRNGDLQCIKVR